MTSVKISARLVPQRKIGFADIVTSLCLFALAITLGWSGLSGAYVKLATPRIFIYLMIASVLLVILAVVSATGCFHMNAGKMRSLFLSLLLPALLIVIPLSSGGGSSTSDFDPYAGGRPIAIERAHHSSVDHVKRIIRVGDDDFGYWYDEIDHHLDRYDGYKIELTGFVYRPHTFAREQFMLSRQLMSCCVLDMSPFGFAATLPKHILNVSQRAHAAFMPSGVLKEHQWIHVSARIERGTIGQERHKYQGVLLRVEHVEQTQAPVGYFYRP